MEPPEVRYAKSGDVSVAYQTYGAGPIDVVLGLPFVSHLGIYWELPAAVHFFEDVGAFARLILFDKRGVGPSDQNVGAPTLEERMDDIRAVMDAVGSRKAVLFGASESAPMSLLFAAAHPERTIGLVLMGGYAKELRDSTYPWGSTLGEMETAIPEA